MPPQTGAYIAAALILAFGALAFLGIIPVVLVAPTLASCAWWDLVCQTTVATQAPLLGAFYALLRLVLAGGAVLVGLLILFKLPAPWTARGLMFIGFLLLGLGFLGL